MSERLSVWDLPTRLFHWSLVVCFFGAYFTAESERLVYLHMTFGFSLFGLLVFRLFWGVWGTTYAQFRQFIPKPSSILGYLEGYLWGHKHHYVGHNPLGALAIITLMLLGFCSSISGWLAGEDLGGDAVEIMHDLVSECMFLVVIVHVIGVFVSSLSQKENLLLAMITGKKMIQPEQAIENNRSLVAVMLALALIGFWLWRYWDKLAASF